MPQRMYVSLVRGWELSTAAPALAVASHMKGAHILLWIPKRADKEQLIPASMLDFRASKLFYLCRQTNSKGSLVYGSAKFLLQYLSKKSKRLYIHLSAPRAEGIDATICPKLVFQQEEDCFEQLANLLAGESNTKLTLQPPATPGVMIQNPSSPYEPFWKDEALSSNVRAARYALYPRDFVLSCNEAKNERSFRAMVLRRFAKRVENL